MCQTWIILVCVVFTMSANSKAETSLIIRRALQKEHEKPKPDQWLDKFLTSKYEFQVNSLVKLLHTIANDYLNHCKVFILYDLSVELYKQIIDVLFIKFPLAYQHINLSNSTIDKNKYGNTKESQCISYMLLVKDVMKTNKIIEKQHENKVVIVSASSQWRIQEFLASDSSKAFVNLLVITESAKIVSANEELPYILYTHKLYIDGLGASKPQILMSWFQNKLTKPDAPLFPKKMIDGFAGHRFIISVANQPPFVIDRGFDMDGNIKWDGIEIRLLKYLADKLNFTIDIQEADEVELLGSGEAVAKEITERKAMLGIAGLYVTKERIDSFEISHGYSYDCATFITLVSTALPRYRAIMGPFQWTVWAALTFVYIFAIFPISFSDNLSLTHLLKQPEEIENMFWYVFGTFTNCFTFTGKNSWNKTKKDSTRLFIGWYWMFTIIVSACYTGSIIAFVTLPVFPATIDNVEQLLSGHFQIGTLAKDGWQYWFNDSSDLKANKLLKNLEHLPDIQSGLKNITSAFFWPYAFLGSRDQLEYVIKMNHTQKSKKAVLHISRECFAPFSVSMAFPKNSIYKSILNSAILNVFQSGLMNKIKNDVDWEAMRSTAASAQTYSVGKLKTAPPEDRSLTLQDTQGMFLLLGAGFLIGFSVLISEILGGCLNFCKGVRRSRYNSLSTNQKSFHVPSPNATEMEFHNCEQQTSKHSETSSLFGHDEERHDEMVIVHNNIQTENNDECHFSETTDTSFTSNEISGIHNEINKLFNFDHLFGENNSTLDDANSCDTQYFGEKCKHDS